MTENHSTNETTTSRKSKLRRILTEFGMTAACGGLICAVGYDTAKREHERMAALEERDFIPEGEGRAGIKHYNALGKARRDAYAHIGILRSKPGFRITDYFREGQSDSSMAALDCTFDEAHYGRDFSNLMNVVSHNWGDPEKNEKIRECFWDAQSPKAFLELEDRIYRDVLGRLARDPYVRARVEAWKTTSEYENSSQAEAQYRLKHELVQYMADEMRAAFGLPPVPVVIDNHWPNGYPMGRNLGGVFNSHMDEIGLILLNPSSPIGFDRPFKDTFDNLIIEEVKHSIDYHIGMLAVSGAYPKTHVFYHHGLMVAIGKQYNSGLANPDGETKEQQRRRWRNYNQCFVERTAKALEKKIPRYFHDAYEAATPRAPRGRDWLSRARGAAYRIGEVSVRYAQPAYVPAG